MTNELSVEEAIELLKDKRMEINYKVNGTTQLSEALDMGIKALRYKPIVLQEHDAEPRALRAILDTATDEIYVCKLTRQGAEFLGITIEDRSDEEEGSDSK